MEYQQLLDRLRGCHGHYREIARTAKIDRTTIHRMLNVDGHLGSTRTAQKIEQAMRELGLIRGKR